MNLIMKTERDIIIFLLSVRRICKCLDDTGTVDFYDEINTSDLFSSEDVREKF